MTPRFIAPGAFAAYYYSGSRGAQTLTIPASVHLAVV